MFGMLRNLARPFAGLGRKIAGFFGMGRKVVAPVFGVGREVVRATNPNLMPFKKIGVFEKGFNKTGDVVRYLRGSDAMNSAGGFVNLLT